MLGFLVLFILLAALVGFALVLKSRNLHIWLLTYLRQLFAPAPATGGHQHYYFCLADHHEPYFGNVDQEKAHQRVKRWMSSYPTIAHGHLDSDGRQPQHSYFYPEEEYDEWVLDRIGEICEAGLGDVEIHLHHDDDTAENLANTLNAFKKLLHERHGFLRKNEKGEIVYGFIHGNWALDNSRPDKMWCGVDNEIEVLLDTGCVFDMTMPSAPSDTQTTTINSIYLASETGFCKSHNKGRKLKIGDRIAEDELLMIQGPLTLDWKNRKLGLIPRIEAGELSSDAIPRAARLELWEECHVAVEGAENHIFIKLHTHGMEDECMDMMFDNNGLDNLWSALEQRFMKPGERSLHYVSAWEMYQKIVDLSRV